MFETVQFVTVEQNAGGNTNVSVGKQKTISPEFQNKATPKNYSSRSRRNLLVKNPRMRTRYSALSSQCSNSNFGPRAFSAFKMAGAALTEQAAKTLEKLSKTR